MAITASGLFLPTFRDIFDTTQLAVNYDGDTIKLALVDNTITPNFDTHDQFVDLSSGEVTGTGYTAGGATLAGKSISISGGDLDWDATDPTWASSTITARGGVVYDNTLANDPLICLLNFGSDISSSSGTFTVTFAAGGFIQMDLTP